MAYKWVKTAQTVCPLSMSPTQCLPISHNGDMDAGCRHCSICRCFLRISPRDKPKVSLERWHPPASAEPCYDSLPWIWATIWSAASRGRFRVNFGPSKGHSAPCEHQRAVKMIPNDAWYDAMMIPTIIVGEQWTMNWFLVDYSCTTPPYSQK